MERPLPPLLGITAGRRDAAGLDEAEDVVGGTEAGGGAVKDVGDSAGRDLAGTASGGLPFGLDEVGVVIVAVVEDGRGGVVIEDDI